MILILKIWRFINPIEWIRRAERHACARIVEAEMLRLHAPLEYRVIDMIDLTRRYRDLRDRIIARGQ